MRNCLRIECKSAGDHVFRQVRANFIKQRCGRNGVKSDRLRKAKVIALYEARSFIEMVGMVFSWLQQVLIEVKS